MQTYGDLLVYSMYVSSGLDNVYVNQIIVSRVTGSTVR